jgi:hypothetical protein
MSWLIDKIELLIGTALLYLSKWIAPDDEPKE